MCDLAMVALPLAELPDRSPVEIGPHRLADYLAPPDEPRCELLAGDLVVTPSPGGRHQRVSQALAFQLELFAHALGGAAFAAPLDVVLAALWRDASRWDAPER